MLRKTHHYDLDFICGAGGRVGVKGGAMAFVLREIEPLEMELR